MLAVVVCAALCGCHSAPKQMKHYSLETRDGALASTEEFWSNSGVPALLREGRQRIIVTEFALEYVTEKRSGLFGTRPVIGVDEFSITGGIANLVGIGRDELDLSEEEMVELPTLLHARFEERLRGAGFDVVGAECVAASASYAGFNAIEPGGGYGGAFLNIGGSDTGRAKAIKVYSAANLKALRGDASKLAEIERALLEELGADAAVRVRLRLGVDRDCATIERDSTVRVAWREGEERGEGTMRAVRSLLSDEKVVSRSGFRPFRGDVSTVDRERYRREVLTIYEPFGEMIVGTLAGSTAELALKKPANAPAGASNRQVR